MKYSHHGERIPHDQRKGLNEKSLYLIDSGFPPDCPITPEDIYNTIPGTAGSTG